MQERLSDDSGAQHFIIWCIPDSKLTGSNASLRLVKKDKQAAATLYEPCILQGLAIAYAHAVTPNLALLHLQVRADPMNIVGVYAQATS